MKKLATALVLPLLVAACGGDKEPAKTPADTTTTPPAADSRAVAASSSLVSSLSGASSSLGSGGSGAGVTRNYTDAVRGCLFVDLSVDAGVAAGRAGT